VTDTAPDDTFDGRNFRRLVITGLTAMMAKKIVRWRNVKMTNLHRSHVNIVGDSVKVDGIASGQIIQRKADGTLEYQRDDLTIEEPLEIRVGRKTVATTMRTPGHDEELAAGFLISEGLIRAIDKIDEFSRPADARNRNNIMAITLARGVDSKIKSRQRFGTISSSCGICGKESIAAIRQSLPPIPPTKHVRVPLAILLSLPSRLRRQQGDFARTGGIHAAGIFDLKGQPQLVREDIGRHNAVDKVIGRAFLDRDLPLADHILLVSGRASFEIMQKALAAGIPIVASVSAPSTLAMEFARECNQTLIGFLRPPSFNIYSHIERIILD
jgi:FdhD protein